MTTKADLIARLAELPDDAAVAVPTIWTKEIALDVYSFSADAEVELTDEQWAKVVEYYENGEYYGDEDMIDAINEVLKESLEA